jgi:Flp pilus assembly protein TadD
MAKGADPDEGIPSGLSDERAKGQAGMFRDEISHAKVQPTMMSSDDERAADTYFMRGNVEMAYIQYTKTLNEDPDNTRVLYKRGLLFLVGGMNQRAMEEFQRVLKKDPEHAPAYMGLGQVLFEMKDYSAAREKFLKALAIDPGLWKCYNYLGVIHDYRNEPHEAVLNYRKAIALKPDNGLLYNNLGLSYYLQGDYPRSITAFHKAVELSPTVKRIYNNLGLALCKAGRYPEALEAFKKGGDEAQALNNLGCMYQMQDRTDQAADSFEKAIERKPEFYMKANENLKRVRTSRQQEPFHPKEETRSPDPVP